MAAWREAMDTETDAAATPAALQPEPLPAEPIAAPAPMIRGRTAPLAPAAAPYVRPRSVPTEAARPAAVVAPDYAAALNRLAPQVDAGADLDHTIRELESLAKADQAPAPVLRLLGDAYVKADRLPRALDAYRQALSRL